MSTSPRSLAGGGLARQTSASSVFSSSHSQSAARHEVHQHTRVADASKLDHLLRLPRRTPSVRSALERTAASAVAAADGGGGGELDADAVLQRLFADPGYALELKKNQLRSLAATSAASASASASAAAPAAAAAAAEEKHVEAFHVANDKVGSIIGHGGATIKDIQQRAGVHVKVQVSKSGARARVC